MSPDILMEVRLLILSMLTGIGLMALYDGLRIVRILIRHRWVWIGVEDLVYWIISGLAVFYLLYRENSGMIRWYVIGCVFLAMVVYDRCVSVFLLKWLKKAVGWIRIMLRKRRKSEKKQSW